MSTVAAIRDESGVVHLASDLMVHGNGGSKYQGKGKWIVGGVTDKENCSGSWALGCAGHLRAQQALQVVLAHPREAPMGIIKFIRDVLEGDGFKRREGEGRLALDYGQEFIWATREVLWSIAVDFSVREFSAGELCAIGSADIEAEAAAKGAARHTTNAEDILNAAMSVALEMDLGSGMGVYKAMIG